MAKVFPWVSVGALGGFPYEPFWTPIGLTVALVNESEAELLIPVKECFSTVGAPDVLGFVAKVVTTVNGFLFRQVIRGT